MDADIKRLLGWQDARTGGTLSSKELAESIREVSLRDLPLEVQEGLRKYRKKNKGERMRYIEIYIFEQTTFILCSP